MSDRMKQWSGARVFQGSARPLRPRGHQSCAGRRQKNEQAADLLIQRAQSDPGYRAWAVNYLGMLAGRGIGYDRIHGLLLNYVRHDKDANGTAMGCRGNALFGQR